MAQQGSAYWVNHKTTQEHENHQNARVAQHARPLYDIGDACHDHNHIKANSSDDLKPPEGWETKWVVTYHEPHSSAGPPPRGRVLAHQTSGSSPGVFVPHSNPDSRESIRVSLLQKNSRFVY